MSTVRVVLDAMQPMLLSIVKDVIASGANTEVVAEAVTPEALPGVIRSVRPDVVVIGGAETTGWSTDHLAALLRGDATPLRIVVLSDSNRSARLHELRAHVTLIEHLSTQSLLLAITGAPADPQAGHDG